MSKVIIIILFSCLFYLLVKRLIQLYLNNRNKSQEDNIIGQSKTRIKKMRIDNEKIDELIKLKDDKAAKALARKLK